MNQCPVKRQWARVFEHVRQGYLKPSDIVTHRIPLEHVSEAHHSSPPSSTAASSHSSFPTPPEEGKRRALHP
jgi:alcohol dehydrogenase